MIQWVYKSSLFKRVWNIPNVVKCFVKSTNNFVYKIYIRIKSSFRLHHNKLLSVWPKFPCSARWLFATLGVSMWMSDGICTATIWRREAGMLQMVFSILVIDCVLRMPPHIRSNPYSVRKINENARLKFLILFMAHRILCWHLPNYILHMHPNKFSAVTNVFLAISR